VSILVGFTPLGRLYKQGGSSTTEAPRDPDWEQVDLGFDDAA
jgi:hypothetical protein